jgi:hypothetical protein
VVTYESCSESNLWRDVNKPGKEERILYKKYIPGDKALSARKSDNLTAICDPIF